MLIIGCDYHPGAQQIAWADSGTGEGGERRLTRCAGAKVRERSGNTLKLTKAERYSSVRVGSDFATWPDPSSKCPLRQICDKTSVFITLFRFHWHRFWAVPQLFSVDDMLQQHSHRKCR